MVGYVLPPSCFCYKQAFDKYIKAHGYDHIRTLVTFSGTVVDPDNASVECTEVQMRGSIQEDELGASPHWP